MSRLWPLFAGLLCLATPAAQAGFADELSARFKASDIRLQRGSSLVPFLPLAQLKASSYADTEVETSDGIELEYDLQNVSQYALLPILTSRRDAVFIGEYLSYSDFDLRSGLTEDFDVGTVGLPVGWLRQASPDWQLSAFVMPLVHKSSHENANWSHQIMGGAFGRYTASDSLWWVFGVYADIAPEENSYIPYVGASWSINQHWKLSAIMPWPAIQYAPSDGWLFSLGASPSGASWSLAANQGDVAINYDAWDLALEGERRVHANIWLGAKAGIGGLRGLRLSSGDFDWPDIDVGSSGFFALTLSFRPAAGK